MSRKEIEKIASLKRISQRVDKTWMETEAMFTNLYETDKTKLDLPTFFENQN